MTIRFQCGSCSQPIEVDDEWASRPVACPYCRKTVTAPGESTLGDPGEIQMASPVPLGTATGHPPSLPHDVAISPIGKNTVAVVALILACCSIVFLLVGKSVLAPHRAEYKVFVDAVKAAPTWEEQTQAQTEFFATHPDAYTWFVGSTMSFLCGGLASIAAIVCGLIGLRRPMRRRLAAAALAISMVPVFLCCSGTILG